MRLYSRADARRYAAMTEAYSWYCEQYGIPDVVDLEGGGPSEEELALHAEAWAWGRDHWPLFLAETNSPHSQFLLDLFHRGTDYCRRKYSGKFSHGHRQGQALSLRCRRPGSSPTGDYPTPHPRNRVE